MSDSKKTIFLTDNVYALELAKELNKRHGGIDIFQSPNGPLEHVPRLNIRANLAMIVENYNLVFSIHCKQFFPAELVNSLRCINVHPGLNPSNRGWFPQVFSIINGQPCGVTIHEMDEQLDHGPIIVQQEYLIRSWDTSDSAYIAIMDIEKQLVLKHYLSITQNAYEARSMTKEGNINYKNDFDELKHIQLDEQGSFGEFINRLRALTHGNFKNAYFIDELGNKVYVKINLEAEKH